MKFLTLPQELALDALLCTLRLFRHTCACFRWWNFSLDQSSIFLGDQLFLSEMGQVQTNLGNLSYVDRSPRITTGLRQKRKSGQENNCGHRESAQMCCNRLNEHKAFQGVKIRLQWLSFLPREMTYELQKDRCQIFIFVFHKERLNKKERLGT